MRLFSEAQSHEMWTAQTLTPISDGRLGHSRLCARNFPPTLSVGGSADYHGRKLVGHSGGVSGFVTRVLLVPEENLGVVILTNAEEGGAFESILYHVLDSYFGLPPTDWTAAFKAAEDEQAKTAKLGHDRERQGPGREFKTVIAVWTSTRAFTTTHGMGPITIKQEKLRARLQLSITRQKRWRILQHWQYDTFKAHWRDRTIEDAFVTFTLKPDGSIDHFTMAAVSPLADFSFDYQDLWFIPGQPHAH